MIINKMGLHCRFYHILHSFFLFLKFRIHVNICIIIIEIGGRYRSSKFNSIVSSLFGFKRFLCFMNTVGPKVEEIIPIDDDLAEKMRAQVF